MKVAFLSAKAYDRKFLLKANKVRHELRCFDERLSPDCIAGGGIRSSLRLNHTGKIYLWI
jgi:hypothetical protein